MIEIAIEQDNLNQYGVRLKVLGAGGAGGNIVNSMIAGKEFTNNVEFIVANTDAQTLKLSKADNKIQLGAKITKGLGAGANPDIGKRAAEEDLDAITEKISGADILFLTAGLGGGTGSGALPVVAKAAKNLGILTIAVVTKPFAFEGKKRLAFAQQAIENLRDTVDTLIVVPNQKLLDLVDSKISMLNAFALSDDILKQAVKGISDIITKTGHINVDFADVKTIMKDMGMAIMGTGVAHGQDRATQATLKAINSPLLENISINGAKGVLINITGNEDLGLHEISEATGLIHDMVSPEAQIIMGSVIDANMGDSIMVTVIATGFTETIQDSIVARKIEKVEPVEVQALTKIDKVEPIIESIIVPEPEKIPEVINNLELKPLEQVLEVKEQPQEITQEVINDPSLIELERELKALEELEARQKSNQIDLNDLDTPTFLRKKMGNQENFKQ